MLCVLYTVEVQPEVAKGADLWSIFDLMGHTQREAYSVYQEAAQHDVSFGFPVTLKDKDTDVYNLLFRCMLPLLACCYVAFSVACHHYLQRPSAPSTQTDDCMLYLQAISMPAMPLHRLDEHI